MKKNYVVVSDFHSTKWPLEKIKNEYLNKYNRIYILGDVTDRGKTGNGECGVEILLEIKKLQGKYPNKIVYIVGNHDEFIYLAYAVENNWINEMAKKNIESNGGNKTIDDLEKLKKTDPSEFKSLLAWLGKCPLQVVVEDENKKVCMAHAMFNQKIYNENPNLNLEEYAKIRISKKDYYYSKMVSQIMWWRESEDICKDYINYLPTGNSHVVVGHTFVENLENNTRIIKNKLGEQIKITCIDSGFAKNPDLNAMLKYDGGNKAMVTVRPNIINDDEDTKLYNQLKIRNDKKIKVLRIQR